MKPKISIFAPANRPQNWMDLYKSIGENDVEFELVFVGPNQPDYRLPNNFRFIRSSVKPSQCSEIALRNTTADLVMNIADDCMFKGSRPLDRLYETYKKYNNDKIILSCKYMLNGEDRSDSAYFSYSNEGTGTYDKSSPVMPLCGLMSRNLLMSIGGIDKNFIAIMWDSDIAMRVHALGGDVILSDVFLEEDLGKSAGSELCNEFWEHDRGLLLSLWTKNGKAHLRRAKPVESFDDLNILKASQGPRGRWRGSGSIVIEKIETNLPRVIRGIRKPSMYLNYAKRMGLFGFMGKL
jgi:GT2 family glycosyltransferase